MKKVMAGIDLHSNNVVIGIMDTDGKRVTSAKLPCELKEIAKFLAPFKKRLEQVAVESTYNWYWLVDGLQELKYPVVLANPAAMQQYSGIKHADDTNDAFFLAELLRLKILPTGQIYDAQLRPVRDLLRRRMTLVHQRTALMLSFKSLYTRTTGQEMTLSQLKELEIKEAQELYDHPANQIIAGMQIKHIEQLTESIEKIEKVVMASARELPSYGKLTTLPGVGMILGMTMGNKYLAWAFIEAANFARRYDPQCRKWYDRKAAKTSKVIATKALACKLAKAAWFLMSQGSDYDAQRMFGQPATVK